MLNELWHCPVCGHHDVVAYPGDLEQLRSKGERQPNTTMGGRIARHDAAMECRPRPCDALHPGHRRRAIHVGMVTPPLLENAEHPGFGGVAWHPSRHLRFRDERSTSVDIQRLITQRN